VVYSIIHFGTCAEEDIKVGSIRPMSLFSVWAHCPLGAANKITSLKKIRIGWTLARVDLLESRPVQCFKCWRFGHLRNWCTSKTDFSKLCFRCGGGVNTPLVRVISLRSVKFVLKMERKPIIDLGPSNAQLRRWLEKLE